MKLELENKVVLVGGASRGIGLAIAQAFIDHDCQVILTGRNREDLASACQALGSAAWAYAADLTNPSACQALMAAIGGRYGRLDVLIANAGTGASVPPGTETPAEWQRVMDQNLFTATNMITAAKPLMARGGGGAIVCVSSICGREALGAPVTYSAAKAALEAMVNGLSRPFADDQIRINGVAPGNILVPDGVWDRKSKDSPEAVAAMLAREVPQNRLGAPQDVADAVVFLASARAAFITGTILVVDGGQTRSW